MIIDTKRAALLADADAGNLLAARRPYGRQGFTYFSESYPGPVDRAVEQLTTAKLLARGHRKGLWDAVPMKLTPAGAVALATYREGTAK